MKNGGLQNRGSQSPKTLTLQSLFFFFSLLFSFSDFLCFSFFVRFSSFSKVLYKVCILGAL